MHHAEVIAGTVLIWWLGFIVAVLLLSGATALAGWTFAHAVKWSMQFFGAWHNWVTLYLCLRPFACWAANECRKPESVRDYDLSKLRKFMARYDPENTLGWKPSAD